MLDDRIEQLRRDLNYAAAFPLDQPKVPKDDITKLSENFEKIISGKVCVE